jgi:SAM-dependent methyltransferase
MTDWAKVWDETYRRQPNIYGEAPSRIATELANLLRQRTSPVRVLDLGCGYGRDSLHFAQQSFEVVALDCSPAAIAMLQNRLAGSELARRITPIVADALQGIPAPDGHFDAVYAYLFFCLAFTDADLTPCSPNAPASSNLTGCWQGRCAPIVTRLTARANW